MIELYQETRQSDARKNLSGLSGILGLAFRRFAHPSHAKGDNWLPGGTRRSRPVSGKARFTRLGETLRLPSPQSYAAQWLGVDSDASFGLLCAAMTVQLQWTDADVASAHWAFLKNNPRRLVRYFRYPIVAVIVSGIILVQYPESWQVVGWLALLNAGTIAYELFLFRRAVNRRFKDSRWWRDMVSATIDGEAVHLFGRNFDFAKRWPEFSEIYESKRVFAFGTAGNKILLLPKSGMNNSQLVELRILISTYAKGKVKLGGTLS